MQGADNPALVVGIDFPEEFRRVVLEPRIQRLRSFEADSGRLAGRNGCPKRQGEIVDEDIDLGTNNLPSRSLLSNTYIARRSQNARWARTMATVECCPTRCCISSSLNLATRWGCGRLKAAV